MSESKTIPTIQLDHVESAAALECRAPGGQIITGDTPEDGVELYVFIADEHTKAAYEQLCNGTLEVNIKSYFENLNQFKEHLDWSYEVNRQYSQQNSK